MGKFFFLILLLFHIKVIISQNNYLVNTAESLGIDLTNENDLYFHDICLNLKEIIKKDVTLDYRRKYYFYPTQSNKNIEFQRPLRNNSNECFKIDNSTNNIFINMSMVLFVIFIIQNYLLINVLITKVSTSLSNTPKKKLVLMNKKNKNQNINNNKNKNDKNTYMEFTAEDKKGENEKGQTNNNDKTDQRFISKKILDPIEELNQIENQESPIKNKVSEQKEPESDIVIQLSPIKEEQIQENKKEEVEIPKEKSTDNYTFGFNFGTKINFNNKNSSKNEDIKKEEVKIEKKEDKMKRIKQIYEEINPSRRKAREENITNNNINKNNSDKNSMNSEMLVFSSPKEEKKEYVREEFFYFKYLLARIEDKRTIFQIYLDLLEHNQLFFKFCLVPFNIYEDRKIQCLYYLTKIDLYFLLNSLLINSSVINDIYDGKNNIFRDIIRSLKATFITYFLSLFLYYVTNIKKVLIKRRYKIINFKTSNNLIKIELTEITKKICLKFIFNKFILFSFFVLFIIIYSFYVCFSFCKVYPYTQLLLLKCSLISIILSQLNPFIVCWLPAFLRKKALDLKNIKLYSLTKYLEKLYIP